MATRKTVFKGARGQLEGSRPSQVFAARLRETRKARGLSQADLAQRMTEVGRPMNKLAVLRIESGERGLSLDEAFAFADVLNAVPAQMLSPVGDDLVKLTETHAVDGGGMRAWLRFGGSFIAQGGDIPDERLEDLELQALALHAQALIDANRGGDTAGVKEAFYAIRDVALASEARKQKGDQQ
jgi:transcriptional regulator with XRE-family HTH domain